MGTNFLSCVAEFSICHTLVCYVLFFDFKDKIGNVCHPIPDDEVFLYIRPHSSGGKGEADISHGD